MMIRYTRLELFMEKLKQMINCNGHPLIKKHPLVLSQMPQIQLLYEELGSMIKTLFVDKQNSLHEVEEVKNLMKVFKDVAEEAHDIVDHFVSDVIYHTYYQRPRKRSRVFEISLNLEIVMRLIKSIKEEFININSKKMDSSPRSCRLKKESIGTSCSRNKNLEDIVVGMSGDANLIRDQLCEDQNQLEVVSVVGMGGIGKTTLATQVFNDPYVMYHFPVRTWVTVSQTYEKRDVLIQILEFIKADIDLENATYFQLRQMLHHILMGNRYLIVIDDIWSIQAWDDLKVLFPNNDTGSRLLLTSRLKEVASHASRDGFIHQLPFLTDEESWDLLRKKVFRGNDCPEPLISTGMQIAKNCHGLPLALVLIAGVLDKEALSKDSWERIARNVSSYIVSDRNWYIETLALSLDHLPSHLRDCFLYLGGFPEDYKFRARRLIWLWMAEGFIQETGNQSLEETAEDYLMELGDRNLIVVHDRKFNGSIKTCSVHDVLRELCLDIATKERFFLKIPRQEFDPIKVASFKKRRIFASRNIDIINAPRIRSFLSFYINPCTCRACYSTIINFHSWMLLMVLDLQHTRLDFIAEKISLLVHLRYLAILFDGDFPSSICNLWNLQTFIIKRVGKKLVLPNTISDLVNLRHLWCDQLILFPVIQKPMNLQTISQVACRKGPKWWVKYFPYVKKLSCLVDPGVRYDFASLIFLEKLKIKVNVGWPEVSTNDNHIRFPDSLIKLTLEGCGLPWSCMSAIQSLPKLEVLILLQDAFVGPRWDTGVEPFQQLKLLKLQWLDIKQWETCSFVFPCLKQLLVLSCRSLEEMPLDIGYIPTLEYMQILDCSFQGNSFTESVNNIIQEQRADGNFDLNSIFSESALIYQSYGGYQFIRVCRIIIPNFGFELPYIPSLDLDPFEEQINRPPIYPAHPHPRSNRTPNNKRSKHRLIKPRFYLEG